MGRKESNQTNKQNMAIFNFSRIPKYRYVKGFQIKASNIVFWGELIGKYIDINANSKTVFTDYAMLKLVLYSPHMFLLFCQSKVGVVKKISTTLSPTQKTGTKLVPITI